jgi:hypothetical protein
LHAFNEGPSTRTIRFSIYSPQKTLIGHQFVEFDSVNSLNSLKDDRTLRKIGIFRIPAPELPFRKRFIMCPIFDLIKSPPDAFFCQRHPLLPLEGHQLPPLPPKGVITLIITSDEGLMNNTTLSAHLCSRGRVWLLINQSEWQEMMLTRLAGCYFGCQRHHRRKLKQILETASLPFQQVWHCEMRPNRIPLNSAANLNGVGGSC